MIIARLMRDASFFINPIHDWQRRYEALRAIIVDRLPNQIVANKYGYTQGYIRYCVINSAPVKLIFSNLSQKESPDAARSRQKSVKKLSNGDTVNSLQEILQSYSAKMVLRYQFEQLKGSWRKKVCPNSPAEHAFSLDLLSKRLQSPRNHIS